MLRPPPEPAAIVETIAPADDASDAAEGQGRGGQPEAKSSRVRRKRPPAGGETRGRKLHLPDSIHDRLGLLARQRCQSVSAVAAEILDRNLPRFRVEREG
jgi:hypothetical protein